VATFRNPSFERLVASTLKKVAAALRDAEVRFCLIGSLSAWVRGGPESSHDLDFGIRAADILAAARALEGAGMEIEIPPEDWLIKAWDREADPNHGPDSMVDLIYAPSGVPITDEVIDRADYMDVLAQRMRVLNANDLMVMKLLSLREQHLNMTSTIATARSIREQIDWADLRARTAASPYAEGFFLICERLGICPAIGSDSAPVNVLAEMQPYKEPAFEQRRRLAEHLAAG
jgi:hypothetical protein